MTYKYPFLSAQLCDSCRFVSIIKMLQGPLLSVVRQHHYLSANKNNSIILEVRRILIAIIVAVIIITSLWTT